MNTYAAKAQGTKHQRRQRGCYATPTELAIYRKTIQRGGDANLTAEDVAVLATCRWLPASQRERYAAMAESVNW